MHSAHDIADPALRRAVADYLAREREHVLEAAEVLDTLTPFRRETGDCPASDLPEAAPEATPSADQTPET
jgi:hypothetical protein